jgi:DNA-binding MarR family transcriptional regulator
MSTTTTRKRASRVAVPDEAPPDQGVLLELVGYNCRRAFLNIAALFSQRMEKYALRPVDYTTLTLVNTNPGITPKRLAQAINVSPPNLGPLLERLEARDLLERRPNPSDKRSQVLVLTDEGRALCAKADDTATQLENEATAMLTREERAELIRLLQKIFLCPPEPTLAHPREP